MRQDKRYTSEGFVIKRRNIGEADRIITLFTLYHGKIQAIAKGIRRVPSKRAGHLEVFSRVRVSLYRGKTFDVLTEAQRVGAPSADSRNIMQISHAYYICELTDRLTADGQVHEDIFELLAQTFDTIRQQTHEAAWNKAVYLAALELLWITGYLPRAQTMEAGQLRDYIEGIIERRLQTPKILTKLAKRE